MKRNFFTFLFILVTSAMILSACATKPSPSTPLAQNKKLKVLATTTIVGDVVKNVGDDAIELSVLLPVGANPHSFQPSPQDVAKVTDADIIFANGAGLEEFLSPLLESAGATQKMVSVSEGIPLLQSAKAQFEQATQTQSPDSANTSSPETNVGDPHLWFDPNNVIVWTQNIVRTLSEKDPAHAQLYQQNGDSYINQLKELDGWIRQQVNLIPPENRKLVTDHLAFTYFAKQYGFIQEGAVIPGYSSMAEPSAQDIAALEDTIKKYQIKAIFVGKTVNPSLAQRVAEDTGIKIVRFYTGSLSEPGGEADTYLKFMRYNVTVVVQALK
ncbi:MAG: metal ABC transporter substrate-binding protein [Anaerolineales bacterium]